MIIDKNIDKSLWLVLNADKKNSEKVVNFIVSIPDELKEQIKEKIKILNEYKNSGEKKISFLCGEYETSEQILYWFQMDSYYEEIDMGYKRYNGCVYEDVFEMTLSLSEDLFSVKNFDKKNIGRIEYDIHTNNIDNICSIVESTENSYDLVKIPLGYIVVYSVDDGKGFKHYMKIINILDMPNELFIDDIKDNDDVKRLVKERKNR